MTAAVALNERQPYEVPEAGIGSFLTATIGDWSDEALNAENYYDVVKPTADQLAQFGRAEDDRIAHVATGETIIPMAVFEEDPDLKESLFRRMREMGIDPEQYVVGNELNSINPVTGQPEFFLKKIFKGIKKAVKGVVKVFKKVAPIILSIGLSMVPGLGPILGTALGSGIGTLIQGGDLKDALKAAAIGGITAGVTSGISNVVKANVTGGSPGGTFMEGVRGALPGPETSLGRIFGAPADAPITPSDALTANLEGYEVIDLVGGDPLPPGSSYDPASMLVENVPPSGPTGPTGTPMTVTDQLSAANTGSSGTIGSDILEEVVVKGQRTIPKSTIISTLGGDPTGAIASSFDTLTAERLAALDPSSKGKATQAYDRTKDFAFRAGKTPGEIELAKALEAQQAYQNVVNRFKSQLTPEVFETREAQLKMMEVAQAAADKAADNVGPGFLAKYGPSALGLTGLMALAGGFEQPEMEEIPGMFGGKTAEDFPRTLGTGLPGSGYADLYREQYLTPVGSPPPPGAAGGGDISVNSFPRRDGAIYGPGTETSDDIPAMLSDGEFVMTAKAVRGAGNGSREQGMRNMYDMMRTFERSA